MKLPLIAAALALAAGGCAPGYGYPPGGPHGPGDPHGPPGADMCHAGHYQYLVGRHRSEIPRPPAGEQWRVTCTTCPVTMDYNPRRLNVFYDERSGMVREVRCG